MKAINAGSEILLQERVTERSKSETKKLSVGSVLFKIPAAIAGILISTFPLSLPVLYGITLLFM
jgi:hypothetical protein